MPSSMSELERAAVQLWEASRLAEYQDVAHGRLALLLLDNAAEMSLVRSARTPLTMAGHYETLAYQLEDVDPTDDEGQRLKADVSRRVVPPGRRRQIDRNFSELVDFVFEQDGYPLKPAAANLGDQNTLIAPDPAHQRTWPWPAIWQQGASCFG